MTYQRPSASHTSVDTFAAVSRAQIVRDSDKLLAGPQLPLVQTEDIFEIDVAGLSWDIGVMVYESADDSEIPKGADGKKVGVFLLHGGAGDYKTMESRAKLIASRLGYRVCRAHSPDVSTSTTTAVTGPATPSIPMEPSAPRYGNGVSTSHRISTTCTRTNR